MPLAMRAPHRSRLPGIGPNKPGTIGIPYPGNAMRVVHITDPRFPWLSESCMRRPFGGVDLRSSPPARDFGSGLTRIPRRLHGPRSKRSLAFQWARRVSNLRPLACEASALPLSYAPQGTCDCKGPPGDRGPPRHPRWDSRAQGGARRSDELLLERGRAEWTNGRPFNPGLLPLDVYIPPTSSGMDVPSRGEVLPRWGPRESYWG
jgi:hypothetical protein